MPNAIAVVGTGVIGAAVGYALAREGHQVILLDRAAPGVAGASFGNVGHIATELVQPLPSIKLICGFWRQLSFFGGPVDLPLARIPGLVPWMWRFALAAPRQSTNTRHLASLVVPAAANLECWLAEIGRSELLRRHGHYEVRFGPKAAAATLAQTRAMEQLGISTEPMTTQQLERVCRPAGSASASGLWFNGAAHVLDPLEIVRAFVDAAIARGATVKAMNVRSVRPRGDEIEVLGESASMTVRAAVICAGVDSAPLLAPFGLKAPLQAARGYHIELPGHEPLLDAPILYSDHNLVVTPMSGRLRASSFVEFRGLGAPKDPRKIAHLRSRVRELGYRCELKGDAWVGARPVLPDYLPGIGKAPGPASVYYAVGHQHIGLTTATTTADLVADLVAQRSPRVPVAPFDLRRFGESINR